MILTKIDCLAVRIPFVKRFITAELNADDRYGFLILMHTDRGLTGFGEASPIGSGTLQDLVQLSDTMKGISPQLIGCNLEDLEHLIPPLLPDSELGNLLRFGLETALYDLIGKQYDCSVASLIGGEVRSIMVNSTITGTNAKKMVDEAKSSVSEGFRTLKLKLAGNTIEDDLATVDAVRKAVGDTIGLRLDVNGKWSVEEAKEFIPKFDPLDIEFIEQPVNGAKELAIVRRSVNSKIGVDEDVGSATEVEKLLRLKSADVFVVKPARIGGLLRSVRIIELIKKFGAEPIVTSSLETGVGVTAAVHLASVLDKQAMACGLATSGLLVSDLLATPLAIAGGWIRLPDGPGLGVNLDFLALRKYALDIGTGPQ